MRQPVTVEVLKAQEVLLSLKAIYTAILKNLTVPKNPRLEPFGHSEGFSFIENFHIKQRGALWGHGKQCQKFNVIEQMLRSKHLVSGYQMHWAILQARYV